MLHMLPASLGSGFFQRSHTGKPEAEMDCLEIAVMWPTQSLRNFSQHFV